MNIETIQDAKNALLVAWPRIQSDCLAILGSELHYQAMVYHCLRMQGEVPASQLGMNVKMWVGQPVSSLFKELGAKKHRDYQGGFEPQFPMLSYLNRESTVIGADETTRTLWSKC